MIITHTMFIAIVTKGFVLDMGDMFWTDVDNIYFVYDANRIDVYNVYIVDDVNRINKLKNKQ